MRKIIVAEFISADGVVEAPDQWHFPYMNEQMAGVTLVLASEADTMLLGRVTYQSFAGAFANAPAGDVVDQVTKLKQQPGGDILVTGSTTLARTLLRAGLVDELNLLIHPIVLGTGQRLFEDNGVQTPLKLAACNVFQTGVIHVVYRKV